MLRIIAVAAIVSLGSAAYAQNTQGAGSSGAAPQVSNPAETKDADGKAAGTHHSMSKDDKAKASQGTTSGSSGSKAGTSTSK